MDAAKNQRPRKKSHFGRRIQRGEKTMQSALVRIVGLCQIAFAITIAAAPTTQAAPAGGPCRQIVAACDSAGFTRGSRRDGKGLMVDCVRPLLQGSAQPR